jgi:hypothetical protein
VIPAIPLEIGYPKTLENQQEMPFERSQLSELFTIGFDETLARH